MVDKTALGATGVPFEVAIERGKIAEFARAIHSSDPAHFGADAVAPPTFLTTQFFWEERVPGANPWAQVQMSQERGMHAEQEYIFHGPPPRAGDTLTATSRIDKVYDKESRRAGTLTFVEMVTEYRDPSGRLVAEAKLVGMESSKAPEREG